MLSSQYKQAFSTCAANNIDGDMEDQDTEKEHLIAQLSPVFITKEYLKREIIKWKEEQEDVETQPQELLPIGHH